ncbi:MAG TPA: hypothetical protein VF686_00585 [Brevundimonas sp.]|jgi:hypothetical protein
MPQYELRYLCGRDIHEIVDVPDPDEAEVLARRRLLFTDPGFAIAILYEGVELIRVTQRSKASAPRFRRPDKQARAGLSPSTKPTEHPR